MHASITAVKAGRGPFILLLELASTRRSTREGNQQSVGEYEVVGEREGKYK